MTCLSNSNPLLTIAVSWSGVYIFPSVRSCGICGGQRGTVAGFLRVLRLPLPILIPPTAPHASSNVLGWYNRPNSGRRSKWTRCPHPKKLEKLYFLQFLVILILHTLCSLSSSYTFINISVSHIFKPNAPPSVMAHGYECLRRWN
jgi:hypothetical protein